MPLSDVFRALSDPTRRQILRMLAEQDLPAGAIAAAFPVSKPSISHHLAVLRQAGLVQVQRSGQQLIYSLNTTVFDEVVGWVFELVQRRAPGGRRRPGPSPRANTARETDALSEVSEGHEAHGEPS